MAIGDSSDIFGRLKAALPSRWFGSPTDSMPIVDAVLTGMAVSLSFLYSLYAYAKLQTRISTATDGWLELIASDYFGPGQFPRKAGQSDASYRNAILVRLLREKTTRNAIIFALTSLTGKTPVIIEPTHPADTGAYGIGTSGYGVAGFYGSVVHPYQADVIAFRPNNAQGLSGIAGYGVSTAGYGVGSQAEYSSLKAWNGGVSDSDIYAAVDAVKPEGTVVWVAIKN